VPQGSIADPEGYRRQLVISVSTNGLGDRV